MEILHPEDKKYLPLAFGTVATNFTRMISKMPQTPKLNKDSAFYRPSDNSITLSDFDIENSLPALRTFAHEFGHKLIMILQDYY